MARRGSFIKVLIKIGNEAERSRKRREKEEERSIRQAERANRLAERESLRARKEAEREQKASARAKAAEDKANEREARASEARLKKFMAAGERAAARERRENEKHVKTLKQELTAETILHFKLGNKRPRSKSSISDFSIGKEARWLKVQDAELWPSYGSVKFDELLFSGAFNSVKGFEGLQEFKRDLEDLELSYDEPPLNLDVFSTKIFRAAFAAGLYFSDLSQNESVDWLTAYRFILLQSEEISTEVDPFEHIEKFSADKRDLDLCSADQKKKLMEYLHAFQPELVEELSNFIKAKQDNRLLG